VGLFKIAFIGGGNMGAAMAAAVIKNNLADASDVSVSDVSVERLETLKSEMGVYTTQSNLEAALRGEIIVLAVKPQILDGVMAELSGKLHPKSLVFSVVAGRKLAALEAGLRHQAIVRAMPNTPAQIGKGMTVWTATRDVTPSQRTHVEALVCVMGRAIYTGYEHFLDLATALSGSGPAYVFLFLESLITGAVELGMPDEMAKKLAFQTLIGAAEYARESDKSLDELRRNVTSPGGTTAEALKVFDEADFSGIVRRAEAAAYKRAQELGA